jgi:hypothetical protein
MPGQFGDGMKIQNERSDPLGPSDMLGKMNFEGLTTNILQVEDQELRPAYNYM